MFNGMTCNEFASECHFNNAKWWTNVETGERIERNKGELMMLVLSELAEAMEGERKGLMDDKLPHRPMAEVELVDAAIRLGDYAGGFKLSLDESTVVCIENLPLWQNEMPDNKGEALLWISAEVLNIYNEAVRGTPFGEANHIALALVMIRIYAEKHGYDLDGAYTEKSAFNKVRKDHTIEARKAAGGKKW